MSSFFSGGGGGGENPELCSTYPTNHTKIYTFFLGFIIITKSYTGPTLVIGPSCQTTNIKAQKSTSWEVVHSMTCIMVHNSSLWYKVHFMVMGPYDKLYDMGPTLANNIIICCTRSIIVQRRKCSIPCLQVCVIPHTLKVNIKNASGQSAWQTCPTEVWYAVTSTQMFWSR